MAKLTLVEDPTFPFQVKLLRAGGKESSLTLTGKYRKRTELLTFIHEHAKKVQLSLDAEPDPEADMERDIDLVMDLASAWDATGKDGAVDFNRENIRTVLEIHHRGANEIYKRYIEHCQGAKLGN